MANQADNATVAAAEFEAIVRQTQVHIRAYIAGMGVSPHDVDDLAQDVYIELYRNLRKMPADVAPDRWLKGIARNLCNNHFRRSSRRDRLHRAALAEMLAQAESRMNPALLDSSLCDALDLCYQNLPPASRRLLKLRYEHELPSAEIAKALNSTAEAIRIALFRIRGSLKDCIQKRIEAR